MSRSFKILAVAGVLVVIFAAQWRALLTARQENKNLQQELTEAKQAFRDSEEQHRRDIQVASPENALRAEALQLRAQVQTLHDELRQATNRPGRLVVPPEQVRLAFRGDAALPRRVLPPAGPLPRGFDYYRLQMRYTGLTTVLQKRESDGSYTDILEGPRQIGFGDKHLFVFCWPDPSRMDGTWVFIDLDTGQMTEKTSMSAEELPDTIPEGKAAQWISRDPNPNRADDQRWDVLFK